MRLAWFAAVACIVAASASAHAQSAPPLDARSGYAQQALGVRNLRLDGQDLSSAGDRQEWMYGPGSWDAFRGLDHHPISEDAFYRIVGRDDLLRRYEHTARIKKGLAITGGALILGGAIFAAIAYLRRAENSTPVCATPSCAASPLPGPSPNWGLAIAGSGVVSMIISQFINPSPIDAGEADRLARDYDQTLLTHLGLSEAAPGPN